MGHFDELSASPVRFLEGMSSSYSNICAKNAQVGIIERGENFYSNGYCETIF